MKRIAIEPRQGWQNIVENLGLQYAVRDQGTDTDTYWNESAMYVITPLEQLGLESAANEVRALAMKTLREVIQDGTHNRLGISDDVAQVMQQSLEEGDPGLVLSFDFAPGDTGWKLIDINATIAATYLFEASVIQREWVESRFPDTYQWNNIHEQLLAAWKQQIPRTAGEMFFSYFHDDPDGDAGTANFYLMMTAGEAGLRVETVDVEQTDWDEEQGWILPDDRKLTSVYYQMPLEEIVAGEYAQEMLTSYSHGPQYTHWLEPLWRIGLESKGLLAEMWSRNPEHPRLLPTQFDEPEDVTGWVRKPLFSYDGQGVKAYLPDGQTVSNLPAEQTLIDGTVWQQYQAHPQRYGKTASVSVIVIGETPAAVMFREDDTPVLSTRLQFVPSVVANNELYAVDGISKVALDGEDVVDPTQPS